MPPMSSASASGSPPAAAAGAELLLLPGTLCDERLFAPLLHRLPGRAATVVDLTGAASACILAERVLAAAPPRFALLGFSLGAIVAFELARLAPDRVLGLAIVGGNARPVPAEDHAPRRAAVRRAAERGAAAYVLDELWLRYFAAAAADDGAMRRLIGSMADRLGHAVLDMQTEVALGRADMRGELAALAMPALVLCGAEDEIAPVALHREIADAMPDATLAIVPRAGHFVLLERPDAVAAHVARWLDQVSSGAHMSTGAAGEIIRGQV